MEIYASTASFRWTIDPSFEGSVQGRGGDRGGWLLHRRIAQGRWATLNDGEACHSLQKAQTVKSGPDAGIDATNRHKHAKDVLCPGRVTKFLEVAKADRHGVLDGMRTW